MVFAFIVNSAAAFSFEAFGWKISWNEPVSREIIDEVGDMQDITITNEFNNEIEFVNSFKETQLFLKELDYKRVGVIDVSVGISYTAVISEEGIISHIELGLNEPEVVIEADIDQIRNNIEANNFMAIKDNIHLPFKVKLKILMMKWF